MYATWPLKPKALLTTLSFMLTAPIIPFIIIISVRESMPDSEAVTKWLNSGITHSVYTQVVSHNVMMLGNEAVYGGFYLGQ